MEQAGGKKEVWGCLEQLLINKTKVEEVIKNKRSVAMVWLNYQKAFDSLPHEWLLITLKLVKVSPLVILSMETLMQKWLKNLHLTSHEGDIQAGTIRYLTILSIYLTILLYYPPSTICFISC